MPITMPMIGFLGIENTLRHIERGFRRTGMLECNPVVYERPAVILTNIRVTVPATEEAG